MKNSISKLSNLFLLIILLNSFMSCNTSHIEKKLRVCVNKEIETSNNFKNRGFDIYLLMKKVENIMVKEKIINNVSADEYIKLITEISERVNESHLLFYNIVQKQFNKEGLNLTNFQNVYSICVDCPFKVLIEERNEMNSSLQFQVQFGNELEKNNFFSNSILIDLIKNIDKNNDFVKIEYRTPIIIYILIRLGNPAPQLSEVKN